MEPAQQNYAHFQTFQGWRELSQVPRSDISLSFSYRLRQIHQNHHVVRISPYTYDLEGYANAGFAKWIDDYSDQLYEAERDFVVTGPRIQKDPGTLRNDVRFGKSRYEWAGQTFIIYIAHYAAETGCGESRNLFLLAPQDNKITADGHHEDIDALLRACGRWTRELHDEIFVFDNGVWQKSKSLYKSVQSASWDDVILNPDVKTKLVDDVQGFFDNRALYESFQVPWKRGVILHGVPGNGKTISIKALINTLSKRPEPIPSLYVKSFDDRCQGEKWAIRSIFAKARQMAPCVVIFEDLDSIVTRKVRSYFLNEVDGLDSNDGILMIGSTNHLSALDPAIAKRPSRFDRKYHFRLPNEDERVLYCKYWFRKLENHDLVAFSEELCPIIAKLSEGFSFAYMKEMFVTSLLRLAHHHDGGEDGDDFDEDASPTGGSSSSTDAVVVDTPQEGTADETESSSDEDTSEGKEGPEKTKKTKEVPPKVRKMIPKVDVPESLRGNTLLEIMTAQAQLLLDEMDNSEDTISSRSKVSDNDGSESDDMDSD